jgi:hypothetical protein
LFNNFNAIHLDGSDESKKTGDTDLLNLVRTYLVTSAQVVRAFQLIIFYVSLQTQLFLGPRE